MTDATCSVLENGTRCPRPVVARGWCNKHYVRWQRTGDPLGNRSRAGKTTPCNVVEDGETCGKRAVGQGMCPMHYSRWKRHGDPLVTERRRFQYTDDLAADFWGLVDKSAGPDGCWPWKGTISVHGYGSWHHTPAHRTSYRLVLGTIPDGLVLDHTCHDPAECSGGPSCQHRRCVNPAHLAPVPPEENVSARRSSNGRPANDRCAVDGCGRPYVARGLCAKHWQFQQRTGKLQPDEKTTCRNGHPLTGPEADIRIEVNGRRRCMHCRRAATAQRRLPGSETFRPCTVPGCERPHEALGLCDMHYTRQRRTGRPSV